jgi:hypothetical protein
MFHADLRPPRARRPLRYRKGVGDMNATREQAIDLLSKWKDESIGVAAQLEGLVLSSIVDRFLRDHPERWNGPPERVRSCRHGGRMRSKMTQTPACPRSRSYRQKDYSTRFA